MTGRERGGHALSQRFLGLLRAGQAPGTGHHVGIEHEFVVRSARGAVDFRRVLHRLEVPGRRLDPGDGHAYRLPNGCALTCDGAEAEVAIPPTAVGPGFAATAVGLAAAAAAGGLRDLLPGELVLEGCSTHVSVSVPDHLASRVSRLLTRTAAPAYMLLTDNAESPGLLVRPRTSRVELGSDHVTGEGLQAPLLLAVGVVLGSVEVLRGERAPSWVPPAVVTAVAPAVERYGWYVDRAAVGRDLYAEGRDTKLELVDGRRVTAQEHLETVTAAAVAALDGMVGPSDLAPLLERSEGRIALPCEVPPRRSVEPGDGRGVPGDPANGAALLRPVERPGFRVVTEVATWDLAVLVVEGRRRTYACVPRHDLVAFQGALAAGALDDVLRAYVDAPPAGRVLNRREQAMRPGLFDALGDPRSLVAPERDVNGIPRPVFAVSDGADQATTTVGTDEAPATTTTSSTATSPTSATATDRPGKGRPQPSQVPVAGRDRWPGGWAVPLVALLTGIVLIVLLGRAQLDPAGAVVVGEEGGLVSTGGGRTTLEIPPGALDEPVAVRLLDDLPRGGLTDGDDGSRLVGDPVRVEIDEGALDDPARISVLVPRPDRPVDADPGGGASTEVEVELVGILVQVGDDGRLLPLPEQSISLEDGGYRIGGTITGPATVVPIAAGGTLTLEVPAAGVEVGGTFPVTAVLRPGEGSTASSGQGPASIAGGDGPTAVWIPDGAGTGTLRFRCAAVGTGPVVVETALEDPGGGPPVVVTWRVADVTCGAPSVPGPFADDLRDVAVGSAPVPAGGVLPSLALPPTLQGPCRARAAIDGYGTLDPGGSAGVYRVPRAGTAWYEGSITTAGAGTERVHSGSVVLQLPAPLPGVVLGAWSGRGSETGRTGEADWDLHATWAPAGALLPVTGVHDDTAGNCAATVVVTFDGGRLDSPALPVSATLTVLALGGLLRSGRSRVG